MVAAVKASASRLVGLAQVRHACVAVGRRSRRVQFDSHYADIFGAPDLVCGQVVGQVKRHQRLKIHALWHGGLDAAFISHSKCCSGYRWAQVGHDDGAAKLGRRVRHHGVQCVPVAHMQVPVVRAGNGDRCRFSHALNCRIGLAFQTHKNALQAGLFAAVSRRLNGKVFY